MPQLPESDKTVINVNIRHAWPRVLTVIDKVALMMILTESDDSD